MSGDVDPLTTGMMYCELICAAQNLSHHERAREWTDVMEHWRHGVAFGAIHGRCRVHRAELLRVSGPVSAAETEALAAYLRVQEARFGPRLHTPIEMDPRAAPRNIVSFLLQPLVENAVKYGDREQHLDLRVEICTEGDNLRVRIQN
eukprot:gene5438-6459_t